MGERTSFPGVMQDTILKRENNHKGGTKEGTPNWRDGAVGGSSWIKN